VLTLVEDVNSSEQDNVKAVGYKEHQFVSVPVAVENSVLKSLKPSPLHHYAGGSLNSNVMPNLLQDVKLRLIIPADGLRIKNSLHVSIRQETGLFV
jgi:hypothetical protein